jgi:CTP:molybdopterin cytidylyltransferase MocA
MRLRAELRGYPVTVLANARRSQGLSSSVIRALRETRHSGATLLVPVDLGELLPRDVARLISRWRAAKRRVAACRLDGRASTPLILPRWVYPQAAQLEGDVGLRNLIAALPDQQRVLIELPSAARDIDSPGDLDTARRARPVMISAARSARYIP